MKKIGFVVLVVILQIWVGIVFAETPYFDSVKAAKQFSVCEKDAYVLMSHNGGNFGKSKSDETVRQMSRLYKDVDMLVLLEVSTTEAGAQAVARLADELNRTGAAWDYAISDATGGSGTERYAYLWKKKRISLKSIGKRVNLLKTLEDEMVRVPATASFYFDYDRDGQNGRLLEVIAVHLAPTDKHPENELEAFEDNEAEYFQADNQVVVGDFNLSHKKIDPVLEDNLGFEHQIEGKTSLKSKLKTPDNNYYSKEYDNIYTKGFIEVCQSGILDFVPRYQSLAEAKKLSDHLPVFIIFK